MTLSQTDDTNDILLTVDLYDTGNSQVLTAMISYTIPLQTAQSYIIGGTETDPEPGTRAFMEGLKAFFETADYSWYGANVEFHAFHATRRTVANTDISPA